MEKSCRNAWLGWLPLLFFVADIAGCDSETSHGPPPEAFNSPVAMPPAAGGGGPLQQPSMASSPDRQPMLAAMESVDLEATEPPGPSQPMDPAGAPAGVEDPVVGVDMESDPQELPEITPPGSDTDSDASDVMGVDEPQDEDPEPDPDTDPEPDPEPQVADTCDPGAGSTRVDQTIVIRAGQTFDGECKRYVAGRAVGDGSQAEGQDPVFRLEQGATLLNVVLGSPAADGIHAYGDATLRNITWEDIGEDAMTIKESGTVVLDGGSAKDGADKVFQINARSTFRVSNFRATNAGKFIRQNGQQTFKIEVYIDACDISNMKESIFRTDSRSSTVSMTNTRYSRIGSSGDALWRGVNPANITVSGNTQY